jgi:lysophospholipase L1-like esterase
MNIPAQGMPRSTQPLVYVAIGASDSYGVGAGNPATQSWPADLARRLPPGSRFVNLGVPGILLHRAVQVELPVALDAHPNLVTVWLAVNDLAAGVALPRYRHDLDTLLGALQRAHARVLIANIPDLALIPAFAGRPGLAPTLAAWNGVIAAAAHAHGATLVDLYGRWRELGQHPEYVGADGLHPTTAGYQRLADLFWQAYASAVRHHLTH